MVDFLGRLYSVRTYCILRIDKLCDGYRPGMGVNKGFESKLIHFWYPRRSKPKIAGGTP